MEDLTTLNTSNLKQQIFELCQYIYPNDLLVEGETETYLFHALKISKTNDKYSVIDDAKKAIELNNKFLLFKVKEELECIVLAVQNEVIEEAEIEAFSQAFEAEPNPELIEQIDKELKTAQIFEEEEVKN